jgi:hypothetical protein
LTAVTVLAGIAALGLVAWATGSGARSPLPAGGRYSLARFPGYGLSFRYPANWKRLDCVQVFTFESTVTYLTNAPSAACYLDPPGQSSSRPPAIRLAEDGVLVRWWAYAFPNPPNFVGRRATIGGMPARIGPMLHGIFRPAQLTSGCDAVGAAAAQLVKIERPGAGSGDPLYVTACFRGPNLSANAAAFRRMLASVRFAKN